jgi:16S rRNA (uracil1498-N3)-methyltransferase
VATDLAGASLFYTNNILATGQLATVDGDEGFHAATVRRTRPGEHVVLCDGAGVIARCVVDSTTKRGLTARVIDVERVARVHPSVTVVQAIPKSDRSELAIELATEAGADEFVAWQASRCVARWDGDRAENGLRRWRAVARSAARQSRRAYIPEAYGPMPTSALAMYIAERVGAGATALLLSEAATFALADSPVAQSNSIILIVGPEGGVSDQELVELTGVGALAVRLGPTVLRTSTAAAVTLGALGVLTSRWAIG